MKNLMKKLPYSIVPALGLMATSAMAEVPAEVTTALGDAKTDAVAVAGLVLAVIVAIFAITIIRKVLR